MLTMEGSAEEKGVKKGLGDTQSGRKGQRFRLQAELPGTWP